MSSYKSRLAAAKRKGTHLEVEWKAMIVACGYACVNCGDDGRLEKDHVVAVSRGGCDCIANIQPLCARCNTSKWANDWDGRPSSWSEHVARLVLALPYWARSRHHD